MSDDETGIKAPPRRRWFRRRGIDLADLAVNSFAAFLGVFLALMIQNWTTATQTREKIDQARQAIHEEVRSNRAILIDQVKYYADYTAAVGQLKPVPTTRNGGCDEKAGWNGFRPPLLLRNAFDTAAVAGTFAQMSFEESQKIGALYAQQGFLVTFQQRVLDFYVQTWSQQDLSCANVFNDLERQSRKLIQTFDSYLDPSASASPKN